jgi:glycosyltransferase involved in cell wall biosynthesis
MNSRFETFSAICAEALACGKPVIATRCGGPEEFLTSDNGILIDVDNDQQLTDAIHQMINHHKNYNAVQLVNYAAERFSADKVGRQFLNIYGSVLQSKS